MTHATLERARGRWPEILSRFGIDRKFLQNRPNACPACGGKDRFRFDDKDGRGTWYCNQCVPHAGSGISLLMKFQNWDFATAAREVDKLLGNVPGAGKFQPAKPADTARRLALIQRLLREARHPGIVDTYLEGRGISVSSPVLQGHPHLPYYDAVGGFGALLPAVLAPIHGSDGSLQSALRIYVADVASRKKTLPPVSTINGAAIRLFEPTEVLGIAEGVETALAAFEMFGIPVWSVISANGIATFEPPPGLRRLIVFADHDHHGVGQTAAYQLAAKIAQKLEVVVRIPPAINDAKTDWLDMLDVGPS